jgi:hypothetical protein
MQLLREVTAGRGMKSADGQEQHHRPGGATTRGILVSVH